MSTTGFATSPGKSIQRVLTAVSDHILDDTLTLVSVLYLSIIVVLAIIGPSITPYPYDQNVMDASGSLMTSRPPSAAHPLGTTHLAYDVLSRLIFGARPTVITGAIGGFLIMLVGTSIGMTAGFLGGRIDDVMMRFTDIFFGIPVIPFALVLVALFDISFLGTVVMIGLLLWRGAARVIRSQTLQIRERPFVKSAEAYGASTPRIILRHILPNIAPMAILYMAMGVGWSIIVQAGLAFIGVSNPLIPSWGVMIRNAYKSGQIEAVWWWSLPPGILISLTVLATFLIGRSLEREETSSDQTATLVTG